ncbi:hypothetical protein SteCoe_37755 [Stentor coeruleus]|uniref:Uncharacterized protein n=1 Tax=Stentor coeruleus TaxID=5963 RepID=A0A1R2AMS9_9CILI|nr:hypothetical protein SteCoe_37755 [Stentor coeruleus]
MSKIPLKSSSVQKDFIKFNKEKASQAKSKNLNKSIDQIINQPSSLSAGKSTLNSFNTAKINPQMKKQEPSIKPIPTASVEPFQIINDSEIIEKRERLSQTTENIREKCEKVITPIKKSLSIEEHANNSNLSLEKAQEILIRKSQSSKEPKNLEEEKTQDDEDDDYKNTVEESQEINDIYNTLDEKAVEKYKKSMNENIAIQLHSIEEDTGSSKYYSPETSPKFSNEEGEVCMEIEDDKKNSQLKEEKPFDIIYQYENIHGFGNTKKVLIKNEMVYVKNSLTNDEKKDDEMRENYGLENVGDDVNRKVMRNNIEVGNDNRRSIGKGFEEMKEEVKDIKMRGYDEEGIEKEKHDVNTNEKVACDGIPEISEQHTPEYGDLNSRKASIINTLINIQRKNEISNEHSPIKQSLSPEFQIIEKKIDSQTKTHMDHIEKTSDLILNNKILNESAKKQVFQDTEDNEMLDKIKEFDDEILKPNKSPIKSSSKYSLTNENKRSSEISNHLSKNGKSPNKSTQDSNESLNLTETKTKNPLEIQKNKSKKPSAISIPEENENTPDLENSHESSKTTSNIKSIKDSEDFTEDNISESESEEQNEEKVNKNKENKQRKTSKPKFEKKYIKGQIINSSNENSIENSYTESEESNENYLIGYENMPKVESKKYMTRKMSKLAKKNQGKREKSENKRKEKQVANKKNDKEKGKLAPPKIVYEDLEDSETNNLRRSERLAKIKKMKEIREAEMQAVKRRPRSKKAGYRKRLKE